MRLRPTPFSGVHLIELEPHGDHRGSLARTYCHRTFEKLGLEHRFKQCNLVRNVARGTLRGMHFQAAPHEEIKVVHCLTGAIHDVIIDLRSSSPTYGQSTSFELHAGEPRMLYLPAGTAHGYQTLAPDTCVYYFASAPYTPDAELGIRWNDPAFDLVWPIPDPILSERDRGHPDFAL